MKMARQWPVTVDYVEAWLLKDRIGEVFNTVVIALRQGGVVAQISDPPTGRQGA